MPGTIRAALFLIRVQLAILAIAIGIAFLTATYKAEHGFWRGLQTSMAAVSGAPSLDEYTFYHAGILTGAALLPTLFLSLSGSAIKAHRFWPAVIWALLAGLGGGIFAIFFIIVVVLLSVTSRTYWSSPASSLVHQTTLS